MHDSVPPRHMPSLIAGLLFPGAGFFVRGRPAEAFLAACSVAFFAMYAAIALTVENLHRKPVPLEVWAELGKLEAPVRVPPELGLALVLAVLVHGIAAFRASAGRSSAPAASERAEV